MDQKDYYGGAESQRGGRWRTTEREGGCSRPGFRERERKSQFSLGWDLVMLKVSPWKEVIRFGKRGKLNPRYIGPFKILAKVGNVAYQLELPEQLS
ncbi:hypothetical protein Tco_0076418, partial [Tanacetum coccineum]